MLQRSPGRLPDLVVPRRYQVELTVDPERPHFSGEVAIEVELRRPTPRILLHARDLRLHTVAWRRGDQTIEGRPAAQAPEGASTEEGEVCLDFPERLPPGPATLCLTWEGTYAQLSGLYRVRHGGRWYAFTQFEAADARRCLPCFDEPGLKVPFSLALTIPSDLDAFANTPERARDVQGAYARIEFEETPPLPTYLLAFCVGTFATVRCPGSTEVPMRLIVPEGLEGMTGFAREALPPLVETLESYFGRPYPYEKLDLVAVPEFAMGAMENAGLVTFREELLLADPKTLDEARRRRIAEVMAHELAHQWFGNLVTMAWWDDLWLNEAFATWMAAKAVDAWRPELAQRLELFLQRPRVVATDALPSARCIRQPVQTVGEAEQAFDALTYEKGALVLEMIERWIGEDAFRRGVRAYLDAHAWGNARAEDLFGALDAASQEDVSGLIRTFLDQPGLPEVVLSQEGTTVTLEQRPYRLLGLTPPAGEGARWRIPVEVEGRRVLLAGQRAQVEVDRLCPHPNLGEYGYYRYRTDAEWMGCLAERKDLGARERSGLLENAWAQVAAGAAPPSAFVDLLERFRGEIARSIVERLCDGVGHLQATWQLEEDGRFAALVAHLLLPTFERLGFDAAAEEPADHRVVRSLVLLPLGSFARAPDVVEGAVERARAYLKDPSRVSPDVARACLAIAARVGAVDLASLRALLARASDPSVRLAALSGLAALPGAGRRRALDLVLTGEVRAQDFRTLFLTGLHVAETRRISFEWLAEHFEALRATQPEFTFIHLPLVLGWCTSEPERDRVRALFEAARIPGAERAIRQGVERSTHRIALRRFGASDLEQRLEATR